MLQRSIALIPLLTAACALLGVLGANRPLLAILGALCLGALAAVGYVRTIGASLGQRFSEIAAERSRVERLLDGLPLAVMLFTSEGLAYANPAARRLFPAQHPGEPAQRVLGQALEGAVSETTETSQPIEVEVQRHGRDLRARASLTAAGEIALVITDLTETRRVEAMRRAFVTNASHELKTPVAGIQALADSLALALERDPDRARRMLERLQAEALRLAKMVRDLLDLARLEEATAQRARRVDLARIVRAQVDRLSAFAQECQVTIFTELGEPATVIAVPEDLRLIVVNLLENAVRYNRKGGEVRIAVRRRRAEVELEISDTGIGIPAADQDRVFERFYRVDKGRSRQAGGTGLGLSLVRHATERHGGRVTLHSELGKGSSFVVVLPVAGQGLDLD
ncbi:MAG: two-component sensor histidine kinase [Nitriliruptorales bacterium]|nr:two-component sensor histidine kinase [Nitriliruptorales bacterium]